MRLVAAVLLLTGVAAPRAALAQGTLENIPGLWTTGVNASGQQLLTAGATDAHYQIMSRQNYYYPSGPSGAVTSFETPLAPYVVDRSSVGDGGMCVGHNSWYAPTRGCWIWADPLGATRDVTFTFRLSFDLAGFDLGTASIQGLAAGDDFLSVFLNGVSLANVNSTPGLFSFSANSGFVSGVNHLDFAVSGTGGVDGLLVDELSGSAVRVPEPRPWLLLLTGGAGVIVLAARRRARRAVEGDRLRVG